MAGVKQRFAHLFADECCHGNSYGLGECPGWESKVIPVLEALNKLQQSGRVVRIVLMHDRGTTIVVNTTKYTCPEANDLLQDLMRISTITCCKCGNPGQLRRQIVDKDDCDFAHRTLCGTCGKGCPIVCTSSLR